MFPASCKISSRSIGLTKRMFATVASDCFAGGHAGASMLPKASWRHSCHGGEFRPCRAAASRGRCPAPVPMPHRAGSEPRWGIEGQAVDSMRHSASSAGAMTTMFGMQAR